MVDELIHDAPGLLALLDSDQLCRHLSRGWRNRLGLSTAVLEQGIATPELFQASESGPLEQQLIELLKGHRGLLQDVPVTLPGEQDSTQGLLSAWPVRRAGTGSAVVALSATCNTNLSRALDELGQLRSMHELILDATGEGIYGLDRDGRTTFPPGRRNQGGRGGVSLHLRAQGDRASA